MEHILSRFSENTSDPASLFKALVDELRPKRANDIESARRNLMALCYILNSRPDLRQPVREALLALSQSSHSDLYTTTGILPNTGFFSEAFRCVGHKFLPEILDDDRLRSTVRKVFWRSSDGIWVMGVGDEYWSDLIVALHFADHAPQKKMPRPMLEMLRSLRILSFWIAALGMEPEILRLDRTLETYESPFVTQNEEMIAFVDAYAGVWRQPAAIICDDKHLRVLFDQCFQVIEKIRKRAAQNGTSVRLTYHLQRLYQLIVRCEKLLDILVELLRDPDGKSAVPALVRLYTHLIRDECRRNNLRRHWRRNTQLLALRVTEHAGSHGEHYITESREAYFSMARSSMIGGLIIAGMACLKIIFGKIGMPPLVEALAFCLNYGLGFCLIHMLHGTVATKQPAMTANAIAASICQRGGKLRELEGLAQLIARTMRSQLIAVLGNIGVAIPLAGLVVYGVFLFSGTHFIGPEKAAHLLEDQSLIHSGAIAYAALAGVYLFFAGLISGYFDNYAAYNRVPERIRQLPWAQKLFGEYRIRRISNYIGENLGALSGNLAFGFLLGGTSLLGSLLGLPLDVRHVALSSVFVGISVVSFDFSPECWSLLWAALGVCTIGFLNLAVSFSLALNVALRARQVTETPWRAISKAVLLYFFKHPREFFLPPRKAKAPEAPDTPETPPRES